jgi:Domain of unknown function (DUF1877)
MSVIANYLRLNPQQLQEILITPETIMDVIYPQDRLENSENSLDLDKAWSILHFLLTGTAGDVVGVWGNVILGGTVIANIDVGYGPPHYLTTAEVREVYEAICPLSGEELWARLDIESAAQANLYAFHLDDLESEKDYAISYYVQLQDFYRQATVENQAVIKYMN